MAHIHGKAGENALLKSQKIRMKLFWLTFLGLTGLAGGIGFLLGRAHSGNWKTIWLATIAIVVIILFILEKRFDKFLEGKFRTARLWRRGYEGERCVAELLESELPDGFHVFNDVRFPGRASNIDHIVVGPTGIFVLDTKNWRGTVAWAEDGKTLLLNGAPQNSAKAALSDALDVHDKLRALLNREVFVKAVLVFPLAKVFPKLDTPVELQQDDYLIEKRLTWNDKRNALSTKDVNEIVSALGALFRESV